MADLLQLDWKALAKEANVRALLEDFISYYKGEGPFSSRLALVVWFQKSPRSSEHNLLKLISGINANQIYIHKPPQPLLWKSGHEGPPFIKIYWTSVDYFNEQLASNREALHQYFDKAEVLYFDKRLLMLTEGILRAFNVITEPPGLIKGWYVSADQYIKTQTVGNLLASRSQARPGVGIVKTWESPDFETCRALVHVEVDQKWLPSSPEGIAHRTYYSDWQGGHPGYFLLEGGALYRILKFEVIKAPEYSARVLEKLRDDRYPEVYLRAVYPPEQPAA